MVTLHNSVVWPISTPEPPLLLSSGWDPRRDCGMASTLRMRTAISSPQWKQQEPDMKENFPTPPPLPFKKITVRP